MSSKRYFVSDSDVSIACIWRKNSRNHTLWLSKIENAPHLQTYSTSRIAPWQHSRNCSLLNDGVVKSTMTTLALLFPSQWLSCAWMHSPKQSKTGLLSTATILDLCRTFPTFDVSPRYGQTCILVLASTSRLCKKDSRNNVDTSCTHQGSAQPLGMAVPAQIRAGQRSHVCAMSRCCTESAPLCTRFGMVTVGDVDCGSRGQTWWGGWKVVGGRLEDSNLYSRRIGGGVLSVAYTRAWHQQSRETKRHCLLPMIHAQCGKKMCWPAKFPWW